MIYKTRVRELLDKKGWNQQRLASEIGWTSKYISEVLNGKKGQLYRNFELIAKALDTSVSYLTGETNYPDLRSLSDMQTQHSKTTDDWEFIIRDLSHKNPDIGALLQNARQNWGEFDEHDKQFIANSFAIVLDRVTKELPKRSKYSDNK